METKGAGIDSLGFAIEGPSQAEIHCQERTPGICDVRYFPTTPGDYAIHVTCGDVDIPKSPFMVPISPPGDAKKVYAEGPGLEPEGVVAGRCSKGIYLSFRPRITGGGDRAASCNPTEVRL